MASKKMKKLKKQIKILKKMNKELWRREQGHMLDAIAKEMAK